MPDLRNGIFCVKKQFFSERGCESVKKIYIGVQLLDTYNGEIGSYN